MLDITNYINTINGEKIMLTMKHWLTCVICGMLMLGATLLSVQEAQAKTRYTLGSASMGGNFFTMGAIISKSINDNVEGRSVTAQATGGSSFNILAIEDKELDFGMSQGPAVAAASQAKLAPTVRTLLHFNGTPQHVLVRKDEKIQSLKDLKGKKLELIAAGDGVEVSSRKIIEAVGLSWDDINHEYSGNRVQAASRLKTGQVDAIIDATGIGSAWITDIIKSGKFVLLPMTAEEMKIIMEKNPEFSMMPIPAKSYAGQENIVQTVGNWTVLLASADVPEDFAYDILTILFKNKSTLTASHAFFKDIDPSNIKGGVLAPLHPGAERFYNEQK